MYFKLCKTIPIILLLMISLNVAGQSLLEKNINNLVSTLSFTNNSNNYTLNLSYLSVNAIKKSPDLVHLPANNNNNELKNRDMLNAFIGSYSEMITPEFGGHGKGIYTLQLDNQSGEIKLLHTTETTNSSYLAISKNKKQIYTVKEVAKSNAPLVKAYKINEDFSLEFINEQNVSGGLPCHITYHNEAVLVSCYGTGNILRFPVNTKGELQEASHNYKHSGFSINKSRQKSPHAHQAVVLPNEKFAFVPDLGIDKIKVYKVSKNAIIPNKQLDVTIPEGSGPRHMVFKKDGKLGYVINELTGEVSILKKDNDTFKFYKNVRSLPTSFKKKPSASAIKLHPNKPYLYVANRTLNAITIFKTINDDLELIGYKLTHGKTLRAFNISPNGRWLIACLQDSDEVVVYAIEQDGKLTEKHRTKAVISPVCIVFL